MITKNQIIILMLVILARSSHSSADSNIYSFKALWNMTQKNAPEIRASRYELESAQIHYSRMSRHWYPRIFVDARAFSTNDPTLNFISLLGQRQIVASDFSPDILNRPGSHSFEQITLGLDFPLYEGGSKLSLEKASSKIAEAKSFELSAAEMARYAQLAQSYASILAFQYEKMELQSLSQQIEKVLSQYKIGTKANPVGYSGLLGLKNLQNRMKGVIFDYSEKMSAMKEQIRIAAKDLPENWNTESQSVKGFLNKNLMSQKEVYHSVPSSVRAVQLMADAAEIGKDGEKARFLPKIGLFSTGGLYAGERGAGTGYTAGAYVQWNVFSATDYGSIAQAEQTAAAAQARAESLGENTDIERMTAAKAATALEHSLDLMEESSKLLEEQTQVARKLFHNGTINALQLVEVVARRVDLLIARTDAELSLAQAYAAQFKYLDSKGLFHEN